MTTGLESLRCSSTIGSSRANWSLDFTLALIFIALVVPSLKDKASLGAALSAGIAAILLFGLPLKTGLLAASLIGIFVGMLVEGRS